jgi:hypothetical protein
MAGEGPEGDSSFGEPIPHMGKQVPGGGMPGKRDHGGMIPNFFKR